MLPQIFLDGLRAALPSDALILDADIIAPHTREWRGIYQGKAEALLKPRNTAELSSIMAQCTAHKIVMTPQGGRTGLVGGGVPFGGVIISLERMKAIRQVEPLNACLIAEAGATLLDVQSAAREAGLLFPLSLPSEGTCTIGGNLSTNAGGTAVLRYGNTRALALGLEVVLPDGRVLSNLSSLRKDNTGYDLNNLFIGAEGTLGIITAASLRLFPLPKQRLVAFAGAHSAQDILRLFQNLRASCGEILSTFEIMPRFGVEIVIRHNPQLGPDPLQAAHAYYALIELSSSDADAPLEPRLSAALEAALEAGIINDVVISQSESQARALFALREALSDSQKFEGGSIKHDISVPIARTADFIDEASAACLAHMPNARICAFGHIGDGNIHFNISQPIGMDLKLFLNAWHDFNEITHNIVAKMAGSISAEHGVGLLKRDELPHYKSAIALEIMQHIKGLFDPHNIMNPGKILQRGTDLPASLPMM